VHDRASTSFSAGQDRRARVFRGPRIPKQVEGMLRGLRLQGVACNALETAAFDVRHSLFVKACQVWTRSSRLGERVASRTVLAAIQAERGGVRIERELAWLSAVAARQWTKIRRFDSSDGRSVTEGHAVLDLRIQGREPSPASVLMKREEHGRLASAILKLPAPYQQVAYAQGVRGWTRAQIHAYLIVWRPGLAPGSSRAILRRSHRMLEWALSGTHPRQVRPGCYSESKNRWLLTPPHPLRYSSSGRWFQRLHRAAPSRVCASPDGPFGGCKEDGPYSDRRHVDAQIAVDGRDVRGVWCNWGSDGPWKCSRGQSVCSRRPCRWRSDVRLRCCELHGRRRRRLPCGS
jgi:DNA-directed RNA polymerase specialized sigma24 family protein